MTAEYKYRPPFSEAGLIFFWACLLRLFCLEDAPDAVLKHFLHTDGEVHIPYNSYIRYINHAGRRFGNGNTA